MGKHVFSSPHSRLPGRLWLIAGYFFAVSAYNVATLASEVLKTSSLTVAGALNYPLFGVFFAWTGCQILRGAPQGREVALNFARFGIVGMPIIVVCVYGVGFFVGGPAFERLAPGLGMDLYSTAGSALCAGFVVGIVSASVWTRRVLEREDVKAYFRS